MSGCGAASAHISAVLPVSTVAAFTSAPRSRIARTIGRFPVRAAVINGVNPLVCAALASAPAPSSRSIIGALAFSAARANGVTPWSSAAFTSAPARNNRSTVSTAPQWVAQSNAVAPSARGVFTSTPSASSACTVCVSWSAAAVTSRRSCPVAVPTVRAKTTGATTQGLLTRIACAFIPGVSAAGAAALVTAVASDRAPTKTRGLASSGTRGG